METKTFSVKDGSLRIHQDDIRLYSSMHDEGGRIIIASTDINDVVNYGLFKIPSTLIRKPKTDEELAKEYYPKEWSDKHYGAIQSAFLAGRKSVGGEFNLTREDLVKFGSILWNRGYSCENSDINSLISSLTPPIYPHTITVGYEDGKYYWETLKPIYDKE